MNCFLLRHSTCSPAFAFPRHSVPCGNSSLGALPQHHHLPVWSSVSSCQLRSSSSSRFPFSSSPARELRPNGPFVLRSNEKNTPAELVESSPDPGWTARLLRVVDLLSTAFPIWVALASVMALAKPEAFEWIRGGWQIVGLIITMLGMGMTLSFKDFEAALTMPKKLLAGVVLQYMVMPSAGAFISQISGIPSYYAAGLVLVACCPGGTASNVVTYLARGNVALSVLMTSASTFLAVVMTPFLTAKLAGHYVAVDAVGLFISTLQVIFIPVLTGTAMAHYFPKVVSKISPFAPLVACITVAALCASAIAQNSQAILSSGSQVVFAVFSLHAAGFFLGYVLSNLLGFDGSTARTISIEVGMQNSVLGVVLANQHFSNTLTALPCAVSSVCHSILGSLLAAFWRISTNTDDIPSVRDKDGICRATALSAFHTIISHTLLYGTMLHKKQDIVMPLWQGGFKVFSVLQLCERFCEVNE